MMKKSVNDKMKIFGAKQYFLVIIVIIFITDLAILLNIPLLRQIFGFLFLTLVPGLLILQILKLNQIGVIEKFLLSYGVSIAFLLFFGLLINNILLSLGYKTPLSTIPLLISFNIAYIALAAVGYKVNKEHFFAIPRLNLSTTEKAFLIVPILFPGLSILGMHILNTTDNNIILMCLLFLIPIYVVFVCLFNQRFPKRFYPVVVFLISISLVLLFALRSNYLLGDDVFEEYRFFQITFNNLHWRVLEHHLFDVCPAISLLPAIYQSILNVSRPEYLYKILYSILCSVFPVIIYFISAKYVKDGYAFLASLYFMCSTTFLRTGYNARANLAMLFFAFAMMTLFRDKIELDKRCFLFILFTASGMVSHYSNTYAFFFVMLGTFIGIELLSKRYTFKKGVLNSTVVVLFFAMIFCWYSQMTKAGFNEGVYFVSETIYNLFESAVEESRSMGAQTLLGEGVFVVKKSNPLEIIVLRIHWLLSWITFAFVGIGILTLILRYKAMSFPELNVKKPDFLRDKFEVGFLVLALALVGLLVAILVLPHVSSDYGLGRSYPLASTILSVFFVIGGIILWKYLNSAFAAFRGKVSTKHFLSKERTCAKTFLQAKTFTKNTSSFGKAFLSKKRFVPKEEQKSLSKRNNHVRNNSEKGLQDRAYLIILLVLIPYLLCATGVMYNIFGVPYSICLNSEGKQYYMMYIHDQELYTGKWLMNNVDYSNKTYVDGHMSRVLSYTGISEFIRLAGIQGIESKETNYVCLGYRNIIKGKYQQEPYNMTGYLDMFDKKGRVYDNGGSEVWRCWSEKANQTSEV